MYPCGAGAGKVGRKSGITYSRDHHGHSSERRDCIAQYGALYWAQEISLDHLEGLKHWQRDLGELIHHLADQLTLFLFGGNWLTVFVEHAVVLLDLL